LLLPEGEKRKTKKGRRFTGWEKKKGESLDERMVSFEKKKKGKKGGILTLKNRQKND